MGGIRFEKEVPAAVAPSRMFKAFILDCHNLFPKLAPQAFKSIEILEGDGGVGTLKLYTFGDSSDGKHMKHRIDELDKDNFTVKYTITERDGGWGIFEKVVYDIKFESSGEDTNNTGCIYKIAAECYLKTGQEITEEFVKNSQDKGTAIYRAVEEHLLANPNLYA